MKTILQIHTAEKLIGKTIFWQAPAYKHNEPYGGTAKILEVDNSNRNPITSETISGDDLDYAFVNEYNIEDVEMGLLSYSDGDRYVTFFEVEAEAIIPNSQIL